MKVVLVGDTQVGKSCIVHRITKGSFRTASPPTIGAAFENHLVTTPKGSVALQLWDTAGQERYRALTPMYYRNANVAILVFDLTVRETFEGLEQWVADLSDNSANELRLYIVGNKVDLDEQRAVSLEDARNVADAFRAIAYFETSALTGAGVTELFESIADSIRDGALAEQAVPRAANPPAEKGGCC
jgi:small GTP-binding protein